MAGEDVPIELASTIQQPLLRLRQFEQELCRILASSAQSAVASAAATTGCAVCVCQLTGVLPQQAQVSCLLS